MSSTPASRPSGARWRREAEDHWGFRCTDFPASRFPGTFLLGISVNKGSPPPAPGVRCSF
jgi:hypothetical protein